MSMDEEALYTAQNIKDLLNDVIEFVGGTDSAVTEYLEALKEDY